MDPVQTRIPPDRLADILDVAEDGIVTVDTRQTIVLFNCGAAKLFGYSPDEILGQPLERIIPERFHGTHRLDAVIRSAPDPIIVLNAGQCVTLFNPAAEAVFGCPAAEAIGSHVGRFLPSARLPEPGTREAELGTQAQIEGRRADGTPVPLE